MLSSMSHCQGPFPWAQSLTQQPREVQTNTYHPRQCPLIIFLHTDTFGILQSSEWTFHSNHNFVEYKVILSVCQYSFDLFFRNDGKAYWVLNHYSVYRYTVKVKKRKKTWNHRKCLASTQTHSQWTNHYCGILSLRVLSILLLHAVGSTISMLVPNRATNCSS